MNVVKDIDPQALFSLTKTTNQNILYFVWTGSKISAKWILRENDQITQLKDVDAFSESLMDVSIINKNASLQIKFGSPICPIPHDLFLVSVEGKISVVFDGTKKLEEIFLDVEKKKIYCKNQDIVTKALGVIELPLELGIFEQFF